MNESDLSCYEVNYPQHVVTTDGAPVGLAIRALIDEARLLRNALLSFQHSNGHFWDCPARKLRGVDEPVNPEWPMHCDEKCINARKAILGIGMGTWTQGELDLLYKDAAKLAKDLDLPAPPPTPDLDDVDDDTHSGGSNS